MYMTKMSKIKLRENVTKCLKTVQSLQKTFLEKYKSENVEFYRALSSKRKSLETGKESNRWVLKVKFYVVVVKMSLSTRVGVGLRGLTSSSSR